MKKAIFIEGKPIGVRRVLMGLSFLLKVRLNPTVKNGFHGVVITSNNTQEKNIILNMNRRLVKLLIVQSVLNHGLTDKLTEAQEDF